MQSLAGTFALIDTAKYRVQFALRNGNFLKYPFGIPRILREYITWPVEHFLRTCQRAGRGRGGEGQISVWVVVLVYFASDPMIYRARFRSFALMTPRRTRPRNRSLSLPCRHVTTSLAEDEYTTISAASCPDLIHSKPK